ncbi:hypothetical protein F2Q68_00014115 [Brassica cretica]|uniref:Uncharacterized protein n=1 Tax=Brassica cretica TaxID=69181 RepID=A0A8S9HD09_BRACR|nr:hypothetical protein F2Q68_00014115 [Brassica cretica]
MRSKSSEDVKRQELGSKGQTNQVSQCNELICSFSVLGFSPDFNVYGAILVGLAFSIVFANAIIVCNTAVVISVLEDVSGAGALVRASDLIKGQVQVGLLIFLGSTLGLAFVEGLFDHRVKKVSYGDGSSRLWEGPLLVVMYSFVTLIDSMMSAVFYFSCRVYYSMEASSVGETHPIMMDTVEVVDT